MAQGPVADRPRRVSVPDINPYLTCILCGGYLVDATCIVECLHSFCRACLVRYLENNACCPVCEVSIHRSKLHKAIRPDRTIQTLAYKLVPGLYPNEMRRRKEFYTSLPDQGSTIPATSPGDRGEGHSHLYLPDEPISLSLSYSANPKLPSSQPGNAEIPPKRYFKCPAALTIHHLKKFLSLKYELPSKIKVKIWSGGHHLTDDLTLMDVAYILTWTREEPLSLEYRFVKCTTRLKERCLPEKHIQEENKVEEAMSASQREAECPRQSDVAGRNAPEPQPMDVDCPQETAESEKQGTNSTMLVSDNREEDNLTQTTKTSESPTEPARPLVEVPMTSSKEVPKLQVTTNCLHQTATAAAAADKVDIPEVGEVDSGHDSPGSNLDKSPVVSPHPDSVPEPPPQSDVLDLTVSKPAGSSYCRKRPVPNPPVLNRHRLPAQITRHPSFSLMPPSYRHPSPAYLQPFLHHPHQLPKRSKPSTQSMSVMPLHPYTSSSSHIKVPQVPPASSTTTTRVQAPKMDHKMYPRSSEDKTSTKTQQSNHKSYSRFKGSNLMVINPDPTSTRPKIVIKNMSPRP